MSTLDHTEGFFSEFGSLVILPKDKVSSEYMTLAQMRSRAEQIFAGVPSWVEVDGPDIDGSIFFGDGANYQKVKPLSCSQGMNTLNMTSRSGDRWWQIEENDGICNQIETYDFTKRDDLPWTVRTDVAVRFGFDDSYRYRTRSMLGMKGAWQGHITLSRVFELINQDEMIDCFTLEYPKNSFGEEHILRFNAEGAGYRPTLVMLDGSQRRSEIEISPYPFMARNGINLFSDPNGSRIRVNGYSVHIPAKMEPGFLERIGTDMPLADIKVSYEFKE